MERSDIVALRCKFLRKMCTLRENKDDWPVIYLGKTWVYQNHSRRLIWQNEANTKDLKVPTGKEGPLIISHARCARYRFIKGSKMVFQNNTGNTIDYHNEMNSKFSNNGLFNCFIILKSHPLS